MSFTLIPPGDVFMPTMTERFAEAEKIEDRAERWAAQAGIALDPGDMYLVGLVLFKAIQEFGVDAFAAHSGESHARLQRFWMSRTVGSVSRTARIRSAGTFPIRSSSSARLPPTSRWKIGRAHV